MFVCWRQRRNEEPPESKKHRCLFGGRKVKTILSLKELELIKNAAILDESLQAARDWLIIGCNTAQRVSDLLPLTKENITTVDGSEVIELTNGKTGKELYIPLFDQVKVLNKYDGGFPQICQTNILTDKLRRLRK